MRCRLALVRDEVAAYDPPPDCTRPEVAIVVVRRLLASSVREGDREVLGVLHLDGRNRAIGHQVLPARPGGALAIAPRVLLVPALLANAAGVLVFHRGPVRDPSPDAEDLRFARRLAEAGELLGVRAVDYLILGEGPAFRSLHKLGVL